MTESSPYSPGASAPSDAFYLKVRTCEGGHFVISSPFPAKIGDRALALFDYGLDECMVVERIEESILPPKSSLQRLLTDSDEKRICENRSLATSMAATLERLAAGKGEFKVFSSRLSFARTRLFIKYTSSAARPDLTNAIGELKNMFGVDVHIWKAALKDEIGEFGAMGYCLRPCCCTTFLKSSAVGRTPAPSADCGACMKRRCCKDFENYDTIPSRASC